MDASAPAASAFRRLLKLKMILFEADASPVWRRRPVVENSVTHLCSPSNGHPTAPDRLLHLGLRMTPTISANFSSTK